MINFFFGFFLGIKIQDNYKYISIFIIYVNREKFFKVKIGRKMIKNRKVGMLIYVILFIL